MKSILSLSFLLIAELLFCQSIKIGNPRSSPGTTGGDKISATKDHDKEIKIKNEGSNKIIIAASLININTGQCNIILTNFKIRSYSSILLSLYDYPSGIYNLKITYAKDLESSNNFNFMTNSIFPNVENLRFYL